MKLSIYCDQRIEQVVNLIRSQGIFNEFDAIDKPPKSYEYFYYVDEKSASKPKHVWSEEIIIPDERVNLLVNGEENSETSCPSLTG